MKKSFLKLSLMALSLFFIFCSCENDNSTLNEESVEFSKIDFSNLKLDLKINKIEPIKKEFPTKTNTQNKIKLLISEIQKLNNEIAFRVNNDEKTNFIEYTIKVNDNFYIINDWNIFSSNSNINAKGGPAVDYDWDCPDGLTLVDVCWSEDCIREALSSSFEDISSGDTVNLTVHHGGAFGGVSVCLD